jgi:hypothetical protein
MVLIAWIALMFLGIAVCRMAALGDSAHSDAASDPGRTILSALMIWEDERDLALRDDRDPARLPGRVTVRGVR